MQPAFLGIEIGGTKLQLVAGDADARITKRRRFTVDQARGGAGIRELQEKLAALEAGADDVESDEEGHWIYCADTALNEVSSGSSDAQPKVGWSLTSAAMSTRHESGAPALLPLARVSPKMK